MLVQLIFYNAYGMLTTNEIDDGRNDRLSNCRVEVERGGMRRRRRRGRRRRRRFFSEIEKSLILLITYRGMLGGAYGRGEGAMRFRVPE
jgi:hypothetical protein